MQLELSYDCSKNSLVLMIWAESSQAVGAPALLNNMHLQAERKGAELDIRQFPLDRHWRFQIHQNNDFNMAKGNLNAALEFADLRDDYRELKRQEYSAPSSAAGGKKKKDKEAAKQLKALEQEANKKPFERRVITEERREYLTGLRPPRVEDYLDFIDEVDKVDVVSGARRLPGMAQQTATGTSATERSTPTPTSSEPPEN